LGNIIAQQSVDFVDSLIDYFGEQTVGIFLLGVMCSVFLVGAFMIWHRQKSVCSKGCHTTGEIVELVNASYSRYIPVVRFQTDEKMVCVNCVARVKKTEYPVGTIVNVAYLIKKYPFGLKTIIVYIENKELKYRQGFLTSTFLCVFSLIWLIIMVSHAIR